MLGKCETDNRQFYRMNGDMTNSPDAKAPSTRLLSIDACRGLVMFLMMAEILEIGTVVKNLHDAGRDSGFWQLLQYHQSHVDWVGCVLHDMIQPTFSLLVGVVLPFSIAARRARGQSMAGMTVHAFWRALLLVLLGVFLRSLDSSRTNFTFEDTLSQIGLGYGFLFLLGFRPPRDQWIALGLILVGYWALFAFYPLPPSSFDYEQVFVPAEWLQAHGLSGFAAHWQKNSNPAWAFDVWLSKFLFRQYEFNPGGYATLSFIPTLGTMILGLLAGGVLHSPRTAWAKVGWLVAAGVLMTACGWLLGWLGVCPVVKRIWTPSWVLFAGGLSYLMLAAFYMVMEIGQWRAWAMPLVIIGANSIAAYCMAHLIADFIRKALVRHLGTGVFAVFGAAYEPFVLGASVLLVLWLMLLWMYRKRLFLRI